MKIHLCFYFYSLHVLRNIVSITATIVVKTSVRLFTRNIN